MKIMALFLILFMSVAEVSEARSRRGISFGRRGGKSLFNSSRRAKSNTFKNNRMGQPRRSGGFMKSMMGAVAGTMIGGFLFRALGMNAGGMGAGGGGGMGFLFLLLLLGGGAYLFFKSRYKTSYANNNYNYSEDSSFSPQNTSTPESEINDYTEQSEQPRDLDPQFISDRNKDFFSIQHAWSKKDLSGVKDKMTTEVYSEFMHEIEEMNSKGHTSTLENLMINKTEVVSNWEENSTKFITIKFIVSLIEYETDKSGNLISGKKDGYTDISESWTFGQEGLGSEWKVSGVENHS